MKRKIQWQFWRNPLADDPAEEWGAGDEWKGRLDVYDDSDIEPSEGAGDVRLVVPTAVGFLPVQPYAAMNRAFDFWIGHANFDLTPGVVQAIEAVPGVETLEVYTRYRFRLGVGLAFDWPEVRRSLEDALDASPRPYEAENPRGWDLPEVVKKRVAAIRAATNEDGPFWAAIALPNGQVHSIRGSDGDAVSARLDVYRKVQAAVGGVVFRHENT